MAKAKKLTSEDKLTDQETSPKELPPEDRTAVTRDATGPVALEVPEPPPIDPLWEPPPPPDPPNPAPISPYSAGDSEQHGTEFPPRLYALGYEGQEQVSSLLGQPTPELEPLGDDATAITRRKIDPDASAVTMQSPGAKERTNQA